MDWERRLESLRDRLADNPAEAQTAILHELVHSRDVVASPSARVRFYGLLIAACRNLGELDRGLEMLGIATSIGGSLTARAELLAQAASLHVVRGDGGAALVSIEASLELLRGELASPAGRHPMSKKRRQWLIATRASSLIVRGEIKMRFARGSLKSAMADALEALALTPHKSAQRVRMSAITLLSCLMTRFGTFRDVVESLRLLDQADKELAKRRFVRAHHFRVRIRWCKALALARLGMVDRGEQIMAEVIDTLSKSGSHTLAENAVEALAWIVEERAGQAGRAEYLKRRYRDRLGSALAHA